MGVRSPVNPGVFERADGGGRLQMRLELRLDPGTLATSSTCQRVRILVKPGLLNRTGLPFAALDDEAGDRRLILRTAKSL